MTSLKRNLCLVLILALIAPGMAFPAYAEETAATDSGTTTESVSESSSATSESSDTTQTDVEDQSSSSSTSEESTETNTEVHETTSGGEGTTTTAEATTTDETLIEEATSTPSVGDVATTTNPVETVATTSAQTTGTTTAPILPDVIATSTASTTIQTGDAAAGANVINVTDANFVNSSGAVVLGNYFDESSGIDLRTSTSSFDTGALCVLFACTGSQGVSLNLEGTSTIDNALILSALTGDNLMNGPGNSTILTGNAYVGLNLVNLANLNVIDSNYLIAALNLFEGLSGDIVFPSLAGFFDALSGAAPSSSNLESTAVVDNDIVFSTNTGTNTTEATSSSITTGSTQTLGTLLNKLNGSTIGGANLAIVLRITGLWNGEIWGVPAGLSVVHGDDGSTYLMSEGARAALAGTASLNATSTALITNHADLSASTGGNGVYGADSARIMTGNAYAAANVLTLANQNIVGQNWLTAVINIFGDWNGNLAFGRPDLRVGERVEAPGTLQDGSDLIFHFTIVNAGDAPASNAEFTAAFDAAHLEVTEGSLTQNLGTLESGASTEVVVRARVHAGPDTEIVTSGSAVAHETDNNTADNRDSVTLRTQGSGSSSSGTTLVSQRLSNDKQTKNTVMRPLVVTRQTAYTTLGDGTRTAHQEITVTNPNAASSTPVDLHDLLTDPSGTVIQDEAWPLDTLAPNEEVIISYDILFDEAAPAGLYQLSTVLVTADGDIPFNHNGTILITGISSLVASNVVGRVAGVSTTTEATIERSVPPSNNLAAAAAADVPWTYALGFAVTFALLIGFLWIAARIYRK